MALSFGSVKVSPNLTVSSNQVAIAPTLISRDDNSDISLIVYDRIANYLHYFKYNNAELFPYIIPVKKSQYVVLKLNSTNLDIVSLVNKLQRENFTSQIGLKQLGKIIDKVIFNVVQDSGMILTRLPADVLIENAVNNMTIYEIINLCKSDTVINGRLCENKELRRKLALRYLTSDEVMAAN
jgi:hypothetical protein